VLPMLLTNEIRRRPNRDAMALRFDSDDKQEDVSLGGLGHFEEALLSCPVIRTPTSCI